MRSLRFTLTAVLTAGLLAFAGCGGDDDGDGNGVGPGDIPTDDFSYTELDSSQVRDAAENYFLENLDDTFNHRISASMMLQGGTVPDYGPYNDDWTGPDEDGWYHLDLSSGEQFGAEVLVRWTPDVWADTTATLEKGEVRYVLTDTSESFGTEWYYWGEYSEDRTRMSGGFELSSSTHTGAGAQQSFQWAFTWSNVSVDRSDYAGSYESEGTYPYFVDGQVLVGGHTATFNFQEDGSGTGSASLNGEEFVRYTFYPREEGSSFAAGHYTLATENWEIEHPFEILI